MKQSSLDKANAQFWNELCGSSMARHIGIKDHSRESLRRFDQFFFDYYPFLLPMLRPERLANLRVLEIGLGYGTLGQKLAEVARSYTGLDLAPNAVQMMRHRLTMCGRPGQAVQGSALEMPFPDSSFDFVVSIGCFHHTGNLQRCLDETFRVLVPGGSAFVMAYNKFSTRQWLQYPGETLRAAVDELFGPLPEGPTENQELVASARDLVGKLFRFLTQTETPTEQVGPALQAMLQVFLGSRGGDELSAERRAAYDANTAGEAAPETALSSIAQLRRMLHRFESLTFFKQNAESLNFQGKIIAQRDNLLPTLGRMLGLDIYFEARKSRVEEGRHAA